MHNQTIKELERGLGTSISKGLTTSEVLARQVTYGKNEFTQKRKKHPIITLIEEFKDPLLIVLIIAAIISFLVHQGEHGFEAYIILVIVGANALFSFYQKEKADKAIEVLKKYTSFESVVIRDGEMQSVNAIELVPGDVILLHEGNRVPADARLVESKNLAASEAALTGESVPVSKHTETINDPAVPLADRKNMLYGSTLVTRGKGRAVVTATGNNSEIGKISTLIAGTESQKTPLQKNLEDFAVKLGKLILIICAVVFLLNGPIRNPTNFLVWLEQFLVAIALAVAAIPEGLPLVVTSTLAIGVGRIAKKNAIIKKMHAIESLGCTSTICTDKTGTLTRNEMTVVKIWASGRIFSVDGTGYRPDGTISLNDVSIDELAPGLHSDLLQLLETGACCNDARLIYNGEERAWDIIGDPTEACLLVAARKANLDLDALSRAMPRVDELPFDSNRKRMTTIHRPHVGSAAFVAHVKGAMESILELCTQIQDQGVSREITEQDKAVIRAIFEANASRALRGLAFARRPLDPNVPVDIVNVERELVFLGMQFMIDPPREEVPAAIAKCKTAGIDVKMITGDNAITARAIAEQIGINHGAGAVEGKTISRMDDNQIAETSVFARVSPEDKQLIVKALQNKHHVVAMTGDGVNDAPALKKADVGVAMGITGTDVSKEAASMILVDDNFATLVAAVEEGRGIYGNIKKFVMYLMTTNIVEVIVLLVASLLDFPTPLIATQILFINLIIDGPPAISLAFEPYDSDIMERPPRKANDKIINASVLSILFTRATAICAWILVIFFLYTTPGSGLAIVDVPYDRVNEIPWLAEYASRHLGSIPHEATWEALYLEWKARSLTFLIVITSVTVNVFNCRSEKGSMFNRRMFKNRSLNMSVLFCIGMILLIFWPNSPMAPIFSIVPLGWDLLWFLPTIAVSIIPIELLKFIERRRAMHG